MAPRPKDITGLRVGYLTAVRFHGRGKNGKALWVFLCDCGNEKILGQGQMEKQKARGITASCGCKRKQTISQKRTRHGLSNHPVHHVWHAMLDRCRLISHPAWGNYGGRGIRVCSRWLVFENFFEDMGPSYKPGLQLDRIDNNGDYEPLNCRWTTREVQGNNRRTNRIIKTPRGEMTLAQAAREFKIGITTLHARLQAGWSEEDLFRKPSFVRRSLIS